MVADVTPGNLEILENTAANYGRGVLNFGREPDFFGMTSMTVSATFSLNDLKSGNQVILNNHTNYTIEVKNDDLNIIFAGGDGDNVKHLFKNVFTEAGWHDVQVIVDSPAETIEVFVDGDSIFSGHIDGFSVGDPSYWDVTAGGTPWGKELNGEIANITVLKEAIEINPEDDIVERMLNIENQTYPEKTESDEPVEVIEEPVEETSPDPIEEPVEDTSPDPVEEPVEETSSDPVEEPAEDTSPDPIEEPSQPPVNLSETEILENTAANYGRGVLNFGREPDFFGMTSMTVSATFSLNDLKSGNQVILNNHTNYTIEVKNDDLNIIFSGGDGDNVKHLFKNVFTEAGWHDVQVIVDSPAENIEVFVDGDSIFSGHIDGFSVGDPSYWDVTAGGTPWGKELNGEIANVTVLKEAIEIDPEDSIVERMLNIENQTYPEKTESDEPVEVIEEPVEDTSPDPIEEPVEDTSPDPIEEPVEDTSPDPVEDTSQPPSNNTDAEPIDIPQSIAGTDQEAGSSLIIEVGSSAELLQILKGDVSGYTIKLSPGDYDPIVLRDLNFSQNVTITSSDVNNPAHFESIQLHTSSNVIFDSINISSDDAPTGAWGETLFQIRDSSNVQVINSSFGNDRSGAIHEGFQGLIVSGSNGINLSNNTVTNLTNGFVINQTDGVIFENNLFFDIQSDGLGLRGVQNVMVEGNTFRDFYHLPGDHSDYIQMWTPSGYAASENVTIKDNFLIQGNGILTQGIFINGLADDPFKNITIENNVIYQSAFHGISTYNVDGLNILNNTVISPPDAESGFTVWIMADGTTNTNIEGNIANSINVKGDGDVIQNSNVLANEDGSAGRESYEDVFSNPLERYSDLPQDFEVVENINAGASMQDASPTNSNDQLVGSGNDDTIFGFDGNDTLQGGEGNDELFGGNDNDVLVGGEGQDDLTGGNGSDIFHYSRASESGIGADNRDVIMDFNADENGDKLSFAGVTSESFDFHFDDDSKVLSIDLNGDNIVDMEIELIGVELVDLDSTDFLL